MRVLSWSLLGLGAVFAPSCLLITETAGLTGADASVDGSNLPDGRGDSPDAPPDAPAPDVPAPDAKLGSRYRAAVLADAPIAYWRLGDPVATVARDEVGAHDGTYQTATTVGAPGALAGDPDTAATFPAGGGSLVEVTDGSAFTFSGTSAFTVEAWIKPILNAGNYEIIASHDTSGVGGLGWDFGLTPNFELLFERLGQSSVATTATIPETRFTHVVATYDGGTLALYVDGTLAGTKAIGAISSPAAPLLIGANAGPASRFKGVIDEVAIYNLALPASRIAAHHQIGVKP